MCGRYRLTAKERYLRDHFGLEEDLSWTPRWNIAPSQSVPVIRQNRNDPKRSFGLMRWGLIPHWAKDRSIAFKTINAKSETATEKPAFRDAMSRRRCLIPADAFYEWQRTGTKEKQAYSFGLIDGSVFAFAGLWEQWRDQSGELGETCTILTTTPNSLVAGVHDRMPVILRAEDYETWLDPGVTDANLVVDCLRPFDARMMRKYPVSGHVNRPGNDDSACGQEVPLALDEPTLF